MSSSRKPSLTDQRRSAANQHNRPLMSKTHLLAELNKHPFFSEQYAHAQFILNQTRTLKKMRDDEHSIINFNL